MRRRFQHRKEPDCPAIILFRYSDCETRELSAAPRNTQCRNKCPRNTRKTRKKLKRKFERGLECDASNARPTEVCQAILFFFPFALFRVFRGPFFFSSFRGLCGGAKRGRFAIGILEHDDEYEDDSSISDCLTHSRPSL
jgi:hypothetical protein